MLSAWSLLVFGAFMGAPTAFASPDDYLDFIGFNAWEGHGAIEMDIDWNAPTGFSIEDCKQRCDDDDDCDCVTYLPLRGDCWKRSACVPYLMDQDHTYSTFAKRSRV